MAKRVNLWFSRPERPNWFQRLIQFCSERVTPQELWAMAKAREEAWESLQPLVD